MRQSAEIPAHRGIQLRYGGEPEDTYSLLFLQLQPHFFSKQNTVYTNAHHTGSLLTHAASKSPHLSCRIIHWTTLTLGCSSRVQSRSKALTIHKETCTIAPPSMTTMMQRDRAKTSSTTELTHIWTQCRPPPPPPPPTTHLPGIQRASKGLPHMVLTVCLVFNINRVEGVCGRGWERKT